ncbi:MAG: hypothetical protein CK423_07165 [Legionella sp.]|nr:MAG: hypothetical protein CK423_07165 [Legionella sp.]
MRVNRGQKASTRMDALDIQLNQIDEAAPNIQPGIHIAGRIEQLERTGVSTLDRSFVSFFGSQPTLNPDDKEMLGARHGAALHGFAYDAGNSLLETHKNSYQCKLLPKRPVVGKTLSQGYYLYHEIEAGVSEQIYITISHSNSKKNPRETYNLSAQNPPEKIQNLLNALSFPEITEPEKTELLHPDLIHWIVTLSKYNKIPLYPYYIFLKEETTEKFCKYLSIEARKPQKIRGEEYKPLVKENGWWANTGAFFGNAAARIWYARSGSPREYGYDTKIDQTDTEKETNLREGEISLILPGLSERFIQKHIGEISNAAREFSEEIETTRAGFR